MLGIPALYLDHDPTSKVRRELYGLAGRFRTPSYGVEYRSIGNFWLTSPKLVEVVYDICELVISLLADGVDKLWKVDIDRLQSYEAWSDPNFHQSQCYQSLLYDPKELKLAIDSSDLKSGEKFLKIANQFLPKNLQTKIAKLIVPQKTTLYKEWNLK